MNGMSASRPYPGTSFTCVATRRVPPDVAPCTTIVMHPSGPVAAGVEVEGYGAPPESVTANSNPATPAPLTVSRTQNETDAVDDRIMTNRNDPGAAAVPVRISTDPELYGRYPGSVPTWVIRTAAPAGIPGSASGAPSSGDGNGDGPTGTDTPVATSVTANSAPSTGNGAVPWSYASRYRNDSTAGSPGAA